MLALLCIACGGDQPSRTDASAEFGEANPPRLPAELSGPGSDTGGVVESLVCGLLGIWSGWLAFLVVAGLLYYVMHLNRIGGLAGLLFPPFIGFVAIIVIWIVC